ncbi:MAG: hypothetical protein GF309_11185 [Candidatus Lokiarchaeota archaeon]|nr:hypothetical protein [Candidatus Lokiarchaeota archaeon]
MGSTSCRDSTILEEGKEIYRETRERVSLSIAATMRRDGIESLMTHDQAFKRIEEIRVIDPV